MYTVNYSFIHVLAHVKNHLHTLCDMNVAVTLVWIPNIHYNDLADVSAKNSINDAYDIPTTSELTTDTCKRLISKQCNSAWQTRWDRSSVARTTYELAEQSDEGYCSLMTDAVQSAMQDYS